jgi:hypothetical protein
MGTHWVQNFAAYSYIMSLKIEVTILLLMILLEVGLQASLIRILRTVLKKVGFKELVSLLHCISYNKSNHS